MTTKTIKRITCLATMSLAICLTPSAFADAHWTGLATNGLWTSANNWDTGLVPGIAPGDTNTAVFLDPPANGYSTMTIPAGTAITIDLPMSSYPTIYGPEWGATLNIRGSLYCSWYMAPVGGTSVINLYTNSGYYAEGLALGNNWWWWGGAGVTLNMNANSFMGINTLYWGGYINLNDQSILSITNGLDVRTQDTVKDSARAFNLKGGKLVLPSGFTSTVQDWISRGMVWVYGIPYDTSDIVIDEADTNWTGRTVVYTTATSARPTAVHLQLIRTNLHVGGLENAEVLADFGAIATNVNITTSPDYTITYQSLATNVATITAVGQLRAVGVGNATVKAIVGTLSNSVVVNVATYTNTAKLLHRYSFSEAADSTTAADSAGSSDWNGTLNGGASFSGDGKLELDGASGYVQFPAGIITNMDAVSVETWCSFAVISNWAVLFTFGDTSGTVGFDYLSFQPHTGAATAQSGIKNATTEQNPWFTPVLDYYTNVHIVAVFHPEAGYCSIYTNGVLAAINSSIFISMPEVTASGDPFNYIGHSLWSADPYLQTEMDEFRIYSGPLTPGQIAADYALGPNQLLGTSTSASLSASLSGRNLILQWPTNSALVTLMTSPTLGSTAAWTRVAAIPSIVGGNYRMIVPASNSSAFFRLQR